MARQYIYQMQRLTKRLGNGRELLSDIWLSFYPGAKIGIIGPNGSGKSTLLKIMAGIDKDIEGTVWIDPDAYVGYLEQEPKLDESLSVRGNIELGVAKKRKLLDEYDAINARFAEELTDEEMDAVINRQAELQDQIDAQDLWDLDRHVEIAMDALRAPPGDRAVDNLSGGERRRVALCRLLLSKPQLLLLDEPTNHLDTESVAWLEQHLRDYEGTVIFITHDRYFLDNVSAWILELENGRGVPWEGNYSSWLDQKEKKLKQAQKSASRRKTLSRELDWIRLGKGAKRNFTKARLRRYEAMLAGQALEDGEEKRRLEIAIPPGPRLGEVVVRARSVQKAYGDKLLMEALDFDLPRGGIVGVIGANGAGKSTLFRMIVGEETPDTGNLDIGETVQLSYVNQTRDELNNDKTIWENVSGGHEIIRVGRQEINSRAYVAAFGFRGSRQNQKVGVLSGGERNRVHLAMLLQSGGNLLLLDEPSNDLDVETLRTLEEALLQFAGCAVVISHDRWFLDRVATHILAFEGNSQTFWYEGGYSEYEADRKRRLGNDANQPTRIRYKPFSR
jgi:ATP-binding cassette ChvD family protein